MAYVQASIASIMLAPYPAAVPAWDDAQLERDFEGVQAVIGAARKLRSDYGLVKQRPSLFLAVR